jgi:hypothetical protein
MAKKLMIFLLLLPLLAAGQQEQKTDKWESLSRKTFVLRGFYVEGFVNQYVLDSITDGGKTLSFLTETIENAPPGTKAKLVFKRIKDNELEQSFHVSFPGQEFSCLSTNRLTRRI